MKVILVDDHRMVADGFSHILKSEGIEIMATFYDPLQALESILVLKPDLVLTDLDMPHLSGDELILRVRAQRPEQRFILLTMHLNQQLIKRMMELKVNGYLSKNSHPEELLEAVKAVAKGRNYFGSDVTESLAFKGNELSRSLNPLRTLDLSEREREVLQLIAMGYSTKMLSDKLNISVGTVESHRSSIMKKLEVQNVAGMVRIAVKEGLV